MSVVGPRPQLVRDMVFMTEEQKKRHSVRPGLSGLAQINGRNDIDWEDKLNWDLKYIKKITFWKDLKIVIQTVRKAFVKKEGITEDGMATAEDFGDYLLHTGKVSKEMYDAKQEEVFMKTSSSRISEVVPRLLTCQMEYMTETTGEISVAL